MQNYECSTAESHHVTLPNTTNELHLCRILPNILSWPTRDWRKPNNDFIKVPLLAPAQHEVHVSATVGDAMALLASLDLIADM